MSGSRPPLAWASSRAASICAGALSSPKNCVVALPEIWLCRPFGAWVAKTSPSPYLRACEASAIVLAVQAVVPVDGRERLRLVHHEQPAQRPVTGRVPLDPGEERHLQLVDEALPLLVGREADEADHRHPGPPPGDGVSSSPGSAGAPTPPKSGSVTIAALSASASSSASFPARASR